MSSSTVPHTRPTRYLVFLAAIISLGAVVTTIAAWPFLYRWWIERPFIDYEDRVIVLSRDYHADIDGLEILDIDNLSGITYDPDRNTLIAVTNQSPEILELSLDGRLLRRIPTNGLQDPEAIEYLGRGRYLVADEQIQALVEVHIDDDTSLVDAGGSARLSIGIELNGNKGFEGLSYDHDERRIFVAKEKDPLRIYEVGGFPVEENETLDIHILRDAGYDQRLPIGDVSGIHLDATTKHLLILSDESRRIIEMDRHKRVIRSLPLLAGRHGLMMDIPQAEGITMDDQGNIYLVSEPNLFYRFTLSAGD
ncbi:SdiA-regulated domain-containing protein [Halotalea alkalilenta]|uniref:SdiA-regulated domain-containing protein n=1 Tax=Halotalea alkalilenta TaxID=376489 RepID=UPI00138E3B6B|nr:SdiA-regulated domain-containing protein [Halotalea alkalilenta]